MGTTHYYGDGCSDHPQEPPKPDPEKVAEFEERLAALTEKVEQAAKAQETPTELIEEASQAYDDLCQQRHEMGAEKYGPVKFMTVNSIQEAIAEVVDLGNYARYTFIKLWLLNHALASMIPTENLGADGFIPNGSNG